MQSLGMDTDMIRAQNGINVAKQFGNLNSAKKMSPEKVDAVAKEFEAQFIGQMLENMFSTVDTGGFLDGGEAEETYRSMMLSEYGKLMGKAGGIGVADHVKREMLRMQEV